MQAVSAEKLTYVGFVQQFASAAGQAEHVAQSVSAIVRTELNLHESANCHQQNHL